MATVLELIDAEMEAFHSNVETGWLDGKSPNALIDTDLVPGKSASR